MGGVGGEVCDLHLNLIPDTETKLIGKIDQGKNMNCIYPK